MEFRTSSDGTCSSSSAGSTADAETYDAPLAGVPSLTRCEAPRRRNDAGADWADAMLPSLLRVSRVRFRFRVRVRVRIRIRIRIRVKGWG